jgi:hypothetical protein
MEPNVETFVPSRQYARFGWAALAGSVVCVLCGFGAPLAFIPALLCLNTAIAIFWLAARPAIRLGDMQFNIGERCIAWREVREVNRSRFNNAGFISPLILHLKLTNGRYKVLVFPGDADRVERLLKMLRKHSHLASFDGVPYRDYWMWNDPTGEEDQRPALPPASTPPVHLFSREDEEEIERLYQKLKTVGRLDSRSSSKDSPDPKGKD